MEHIKKSLSREYNGNGYLSISRLFLRALVRSCLSFKEAQERAEKEAREKERQERTKRRNKILDFIKK